MSKTNPQALLAALKHEERVRELEIERVARTMLRALHYLVEKAAAEEPEEELPPVDAEVEFYDHSESKVLRGTVIRHTSGGLAAVQTRDGVTVLPGRLLTVVEPPRSPEPARRASMAEKEVKLGYRGEIGTGLTREEWDAMSEKAQDEFLLERLSELVEPKFRLPGNRFDIYVLNGTSDRDD